MAKFFEYQGKALFKQAGIPIPAGEAVKTPQDAAKAAEKIGKPVVIKAQVWAGGPRQIRRGKVCGYPPGS